MRRGQEQVMVQLALPEGPIERMIYGQGQGGLVGKRAKFVLVLCVCDCILVEGGGSETLLKYVVCA